MTVERVAYTVDEACAALGVSRSLLYREMNRGHIAYRQCGGKRLISVAELDRYANPSHHTVVVEEFVFS